MSRPSQASILIVEDEQPVATTARPMAAELGDESIEIATVGELGLALERAADKAINNWH
jgi:hypothetical protein